MAKSQNRSGNPAKKARSSATSWKGKTSGGVDLELPSGNVALCKRVRPEMLLASGVLPDSLSKIVMEAIQENKGLRPEEIGAQIDSDPKAMGQMLLMLDNVCVSAFISPKVSAVPGHFEGEKWVDEERDPELLYVDDIDLEDKTFVMNWAMAGDADLASFRTELASTVAGVQAGLALEDSA